MRLFDEADSTVPLELLSSQSFPSGVMYLVYGPSAAPAEAGYEEARAHIAKPSE
jgi:hypothetical protein